MLTPALLLTLHIASLLLPYCSALPPFDVLLRCHSCRSLLAGCQLRLAAAVCWVARCRVPPLCSLLQCYGATLLTSHTLLVCLISISPPIPSPKSIALRSSAGQGMGSIIVLAVV
ncbi:hypothetical protein NDU88_002678 [Pleurodeles waltl]|uniref:Secreted protein n=1 Tax=Pleurodeles waltl TaxID=8319 RepID=A0AAV7LES2_PLEWA|nr:hypothetical protein NDU88_002678 [Pleurodeles waltl]